MPRFLPYVGYVTIAMVNFQHALVFCCSAKRTTQNDFPQLKYALLGVLGLLALVQRE